MINKDLENAWAVQGIRQEKCAKLEEENENLTKCNLNLQNHIDKVEEENKKLNEKVRFLEECLDRKEKLNERYRKELEELKSTYVYDAKQVRDIC